MTTDSNPFTKIESQILTLDHSIHELRQAILEKGYQAITNDIGGVPVAVEETGLSKDSIYRLVHERKIPHSKREGRLYFSRKAIRQWLLDGERSSNTNK